MKVAKLDLRLMSSARIYADSGCGCRGMELDVHPESDEAAIKLLEKQGSTSDIKWRETDGIVFYHQGLWTFGTGTWDWRNYASGYCAGVGKAGQRSA